MSLTDKLSIIGIALEQYILDGKDDLELVDVWYSDDDGSVPQMPAVTIEPGTKTRIRSDTGHTTLNSFSFDITLYHASLSAPGVIRKQCDERAEALEEYLHGNMRLNGLVLDSFVQSMESGVATRRRVVARATRLLWIARTKTRLV